MFAPLLLAAALGSDAQLVLDIRAKAIYPDDKSFARAGDSNVESVASYIFIGATGCELGASSSEPTRPISAGWHVTGKVLQRTGDSLLARIEWERLWDQSHRLTGGSKKSMEVWIRAGDSLPLDEIASTPTPPCRAQGARLEATVTDQVVGPPAAHMTGTVGAGPIGHGTGSGGGGRVGSAATAGGVSSGGGRDRAAARDQAAARAPARRSVRVSRRFSRSISTCGSCTHAPTAAKTRSTSA